MTSDAKKAKQEGNHRYDIRFVQITVEVKVSGNIDISDVDLDYGENYFVRKRDEAILPGYKKDYDTCRAIVKWASTCNGKFQSAQIWHDNRRRNSPYIVYLRFDFDSVEMSEEFRKDLHRNVEGAIQH